MTFSIIEKASFTEFEKERYDIVLEARGVILPDTYQSMLNFLNKNSIFEPFSNRRILMRFKSRGGQVLAALNMSRTIRWVRIDTVVKEYCESACVFAFIGGNRRYLNDGHLGFHRASIGGFELNTAQVYEFSADISDFLRSNGISNEPIRMMAQYGISDMRRVKSNEATELNLVNSGYISYGWSTDRKKKLSFLINDFPGGSSETYLKCSTSGLIANFEIKISFLESIENKNFINGWRRLGSDKEKYLKLYIFEINSENSFVRKIMQNPQHGYHSYAIDGTRITEEKFSHSGKVGVRFRFSAPLWPGSIRSYSSGGKTAYLYLFNPADQSLTELGRIVTRGIGPQETSALGCD